MLGSMILEALLLAQDRYHVTVLVREQPQQTSTQHVDFRVVDYDSDLILTDALQNQDVLVSAIGKGALAFQPLLVRAAVRAGVKRIIPSEFGADLRNLRTRAMPVYRLKVAVEIELEKLAASTDVTYTFIYTNCLLDWAVSTEGRFLLDPVARAIRIYDGGKGKFSTTTCRTAARAVVAVLDHYAETANRAVYVHDAVLTQMEILDMAKSTPGIDIEPHWITTHVDTAEQEATALQAVREGATDPKLFFAFAIRAAVAPHYGGLFLRTDNEMLGLPEMTPTQVRELVQEAIRDSSRKVRS